MSGMNRRKVEKISKKVRCDHVRSGKIMQVKVWSDKAKKVRESPGKVGKIKVPNFQWWMMFVFLCFPA